MDRHSSAALINLGGIYSQSANLERAKSLYAQAASMDKASVAARLGLARGLEASNFADVSADGREAARILAFGRWPAGLRLGPATGPWTSPTP